MIVLVTGASGFLGSWVVRALCAAGYSPRALVRRRNWQGPTGAQVVIGDVLDKKSVEQAMEGIDAVIHAAGNVGVVGSEIFDVNVEGTRIVLEAALARGVRVVHTSTIGTLGVTDQPKVLNECAPFNPHGYSTDYVESKRHAEQIMRMLVARGLNAVALNPGIMLGPGDVHFTSTQIVLQYLKGTLALCPRGGSSFCDVRDVASAHVAALTKGRRGERYLVAGENLSYAALCDMLRELSGLHQPWPLSWPMVESLAFFSDAATVFGLNPFPGVGSALRYAQYYNYCDSSKAERELGYCQRTTISSLRDTIVDHLARGVVEPVTPELRALLASFSR